MIDFFGGDDSLDRTIEMIAKNKQLYGDIALPEMKDYVPEALQYESANAELIGEDPRLKAKQMAALEEMAGLADQGLSMEDQLAFSQAQEMANKRAKQTRDAVMQNAQARGIAGSGMEFAMGEMANQEESERARRAAMEQAASSARMRALNNQAYMSALGGMRNQDLNVNQSNAEILNRFNMANTQGRNQTNQGNVQNRNQAQQYNNDMRQRDYQNQMRRADSMAGVNNQVGNAYANQSAADAERRRAIGGAIGAGVGAIAGGGQGAAIGSTVGRGFF